MENTEIPAVSIINQQGKILMSFCLFVAFIAYGCMLNLLPPTLLHMALLFNEDITKMALGMSCFSVGYMIGPLLTATLFDKFNAQLQLSAVCVIMGIIMMFVTWLPNIYYFYFFVTLAAIFAGYFDSSAQPYPIRLWSGHRYKEPIAQAMCCFITVGHFVGPFVIRPFLVELPDTYGSGLLVDMNVTGSANITSQNHGNYSTPLNNTIITVVSGIESVHYPYIIFGLATCLASFLFLLTYFLNRVKTGNSSDNSAYTATNQNDHQVVGNIYNEKFFKVVFLLITAAFNSFLFTAMMIPFQYLPAFVMKGLGWSVDKGPLVASVFSAASVIGRLCGIPIAARVKARTMLQANIIITMFAYILLIFVTSSRRSLLWTSTILAGLGTSTGFPCLLLWTSSLFPLTGKIAALFFISGSLGLAMSSALTGFMFEHYSHMWVVYICLPAIVLCGLLHLATLLFMKMYIRKNDPGRFEENKPDLCQVITEV